MKIIAVMTFLLSICAFSDDGKISSTLKLDSVIINYTGLSSNTCGTKFTGIEIKDPSVHPANIGLIKVSYEQVSDLEEGIGCGASETLTKHEVKIPKTMLKDHAYYYILITERFNITRSGINTKF